MEWFLGHDGKSLGPFSSAEIATMVQEGKVVADTPIRHHADPRWFTAAQIPGLLPATPAPAAPAQSPLRVAKPLAATSAAPPTKAPPVQAPPVAAPPIAAPPIIAQAAPSGNSLPFQIRTDTPSASKTAGPKTETKQPATPLTHEELRRLKKQRGQRNLMILGGTAFTIVVVTILVFALRSRGTNTPVADSTPAPETAALPETSLAAAPAAAPTESNPTPPPETAPPSAATNVTAKKAVSAVNPAIAELRLVRDWMDITKRAVNFNSVRIQVTKAWIAGDLSGTPLPAPKPASKFEAPPEEKPAASGEESPPDDSYIFMEIQMTNSKPESLKVTSWNQASKTPGILTTEDLTPLAPIPADQLPSGSNEQELSLLPKTPYIQTLVFRGPVLNEGPLRLALPRTAIQPKSQGYFSFEIPTKVYKPSPDEALANKKSRQSKLSPAEELTAQIEAFGDPPAMEEEKAAAKPAAGKMAKEPAGDAMPTEEMMEEENATNPTTKKADSKTSKTKAAPEKPAKKVLTKEEKLEAAFDKAVKSISPDGTEPPPTPPANNKTKSTRKSK